MPFYVQFRNFKYLAAISFAVAGSAMPENALGARIARFSAEGQNHISSSQIRSDIESTCTITVVNTSAYKQRVTVNVRLVATATNPGGIYATSGNCGSGNHSYSGTTTYTKSFDLGAFKGSGTTECAAQGGGSPSDTCTMPASGETLTFPIICKNTLAYQSVRCEGDVTVDNAETTPGHVIASGTLGIFVEAKGGASLSTDNLGNESLGTSKTNTAAPTFLPIVIGEGRPF